MTDEREIREAQEELARENYKAPPDIVTPATMLLRYREMFEKQHANVLASFRAMSADDRIELVFFMALQLNEGLRLVHMGEDLPVIAMDDDKIKPS